jgi:hypothetical protein
MEIQKEQANPLKIRICFPTGKEIVIYVYIIQHYSIILLWSRTIPKPEVDM